MVIVTSAPGRLPFIELLRDLAPDILLSFLNFSFFNKILFCSMLSNELLAQSVNKLTIKTLLSGSSVLIKLL